jgi:threonine dehydrogenase-like Zn-dependent dehydrogenase
MGPIGFAGVLSARARGWSVTLAGRDELDSPRVALARSLGAHYLSTTAIDGPPHDVERSGFDLLLECSGSETLMISAAEAVRGCGIIVWLGSARHPQPGEYNLGQLMRTCYIRNQIILGSVNAAPRDFASALAHLRHFHRQMPRALAQLITARVQPRASLPHFTQRPPQSIKTVLMYDA